MKSGERVTYYELGPGRWLRRVWMPQCTARVFIYGRCQGVKGHEGLHWRYSPSGDFDWANNKSDPGSNPDGEGVAGSTPPGHDDYVHPENMQDQYYVSQHVDTEVTDVGLIAMLEKGETPERDASIDRPVRDQAVLAFLKGRTAKHPARKKRGRGNRG